MKELFLPYELAVIAKEKGFDEDCLAHHRKNGTSLYWGRINSDLNPSLTPAPLYQQIVDWFKTEHKIHIEPFSTVKNLKTCSSETVYRVQRFGKVVGYRDSNYKTLNKAIKEAFKLI